MSATLWLIAGLIGLLLSWLFALFMGRFIGNRWDDVDAALEYRTADQRQIDRDVAKALEKAQ